MLRKLFIKTNGCQMNDYDSSKMVDILKASHQVELTATPEDADIFLLNTCSIREKAQEKVFSKLGQWRPYKENNPDLIIGVGGCVPSQEGAQIIRRAPFVDIVFGPQTLHRLPKMIDMILSKKEKHIVDVSFPEIEKFDHLPKPRAEGPTAFVSIMEGCSKYCSYCIVPFTRGEEISRPLDDVIQEVHLLARQGVREITFLGQNVNDYQGAMHEGGTADLALLLHCAASIDGIDRIRFTTSHPLAFSENLIDAYASVRAVANHLHLPVQSGSDRILTLMKRGYTRLEFKYKIRELRKVRPNIALSSDFIVGFPGETEEDFEDTMQLIRDMNFDHSFSFIFSPRPGTPAAKLKDDTPISVKKQRLKLLQDLVALQARQHSEALYKTHQKILVTGKAKKYEGQLSGRTECNRVVNFEGAPDQIGQFITVEITEICPNSLKGKIVVPACA